MPLKTSMITPRSRSVGRYATLAPLNVPLSNQHGRGRAADAGHVVVLGQPEPRVAPPLRVLRQLQRVAEGQGRRAALDDRREIQGRERNHPLQDTRSSERLAGGATLPLPPHFSFRIEFESRLCQALCRPSTVASSSARGKVGRIVLPKFRLRGRPGRMTSGGGGRLKGAHTLRPVGTAPIVPPRWVRPFDLGCAEAYAFAQHRGSHDGLPGGTR